MAKAIISESDFNSIPAGSDLKKEYVKIESGKHAGEYMLKVDEVHGYALEDVAGLKSTLSKAKQAKQELEKWKAELLGDDENFDIAKAREAMAKLEEMKNWTPDQKVKEQIESTKRQITEKYEKELGEARKNLAARDSDIERLMIDTVATQAITELKGNVKLLLPIVKSACKVVRGTDGKVKVIVKDADGSDTPRMTRKQGSQDDMSIAEYVESLKSDESYAPAFSGSGASGTGGKGTPAKKPGQQPPRQSTGTDDGDEDGDGVHGLGFTDQLREQRRAEWEAAGGGFARA